MTRAWLLAAVLLAAPSAGARDIPGKVPVAEAWERFFATADLETVAAAVAQAAAVFTGEGVLEDGACERARDELDKAVAVAPVSLMAWYARYRCAEAAGQAAAAEEALGAFTALAQYGLAEFDRHQLTPVRVVAEPDVSAFIWSSGLQHLVTYYDEPLSRVPWLRMHVWLRDERTGRERWLQFDFVDSLLRLLRRPAETSMPTFRLSFVRGVLQAGEGDVGTAVGDAQAALAAAEIQDPVRREQRLVELLQEGNPVMAFRGAPQCLARNEAWCVVPAIDALLAHAEAGMAMPLLWLAYAHAEGRGVPADPERATGLLAAAAERLPPHQAIATLLGMLQSVGAPLPRQFEPDFRAAVAARDPRAVALQVARESAAGEVTAETSALWQSLADAGIEPLVLADAGVLAERLLRRQELSPAERGRLARRLPVVVRMAGAGVPAAQATIVRLAAVGRPADTPGVAPEEWVRRAASAGDVGSMVTMARSYDVATEQSRLLRQGWLQSAVLLGRSEAAQVALAALFATGASGLDGGPAEAITLLAGPSQRPDGVWPRRLLAHLLLTGPEELRDPPRARELLERDARAGDQPARRQLGGYLLTGVLGPPSLDAALVWLGPALDAGEPATLNEVAWILCTSPSPAVRNSRAGLAYAERLMATGEVPPAYVDTVAACYADAGDHRRAVELQEQAIAAFVGRGADAGTLAATRARLARYQSGKAYTEEPRPQALGP